MKRDWTKLTPIGFVIAMCVMLAMYLPTPYVVYKPGMAADVGPMVHVDDADVREDSVFMLTTVRQNYPNWITYFIARFNPNWDVYRKEDIYQEGESRNEYSLRQQYVMLSSQSNAVRAAYQAANIQYEIVEEGVVVLRTIPGMPAEDELRAGDRILELDDKQITIGDELIERIRGKNAGDSVHIRYERNGQTNDSDITLGDYAELPEELGGGQQESRPGLGIITMTMLDVKASDPIHQVNITVEDIGGPSAGTIFALEIYDQLTPGDLTKGYRIAGTGQIDAEGHVGSIGGVKHKIVAADRERADLFFVPEANAEDAQARATEIGTAMKVIPIRTLDDALSYLSSIPANSSKAD